MNQNRNSKRARATATALPLLLLSLAALLGSYGHATAATNPTGGFESSRVVNWDGALGTAGSTVSALPAGGASLRIIYFNDLHDSLTLPSTAKGDNHVFSQMEKRVKEARQAAGGDEAVLFVSAGDDHTGSVLDEFVGGDVNSFVLDPAYRVYSAAGLDAAVIGNHELDRGAGVLAKAISADARFPVLSANLSNSKSLAWPLTAPVVIGVAKGIRVAIIGLTTPDETLIRATDDPTLRFTDPVATLANLLPALDRYADVFIVLSHVGFNASGDGARHEVRIGDLDIAKAAALLTKKPVVLVGGHTHTVLNQAGLDPKNVVDGVPVLQAGGQGQFYGELLLRLTAVGEGVQGQVTESRLIPIKKRDDRVKEGDAKYASLEHDSDYDVAFEATAITPLLSALKSKLSETIGSSDSTTDNSNATTFADRYIGECGIANFMNDAVVARSSTFPGAKVDIAVFNSSGVASGVPTGQPLTFNDLYAMMPYADAISIAQLTGGQLKEIVRSNAKRLVRPEELQGAKPVDTNAYISRGYLDFSKALRYTVQLGKTAADADAVDITLNGIPIDSQLDKTFRVAFSSYIAGGGEGWSGKPVGAGLPDSIVGYDIRSIPKVDTGLIYRNEIIAFLRSVGSVGATTSAVKDGRVAVKQ